MVYIVSRSYCVMVCLGLALSALGDALLVWPSELESGMLMFGLAHICYIEAFGWRSNSPWYPGTAVTVYLAAAVYVAAVPPPPALRFLVPAYAALLATMAWRGAARGGCAAAGAALFLISDAVLGYSLFAGPVPHKQVTCYIPLFLLFFYSYWRLVVGIIFINRQKLCWLTRTVHIVSICFKYSRSGPFHQP